jgi:nitroreductase/Pyruvate/2-oxoacid:ferredoxin oxidoreductase delta subunit
VVEKKIDLSVCTRCGLCAEVCPLAIIHMRGEPPYPSTPAKRDPFCVACGHCEAVCPVHAIEIISPHLQDSGVSTLGAKLEAEVIFPYFANRRSIRIYKSDPVARPILEKLMNIVRYAPSAVNRQPVKWTVVQTRERVEGIAAAVIDWARVMVQEDSPIAQRLNLAFLVALWKSGKDPICRKAPHLIIAYCHKDDASGAGDATIALSHLELAAPSLGLGACWAGYVNIALAQLPDLRASLGIPPDCLSRGVMMLGYPAVSYAGIPKRNKAEISWL